MTKWLLVSAAIYFGSVHAFAGESIFPTAGEMASWCQPYKTATLKGDQVSGDFTMESQMCKGAFMTIQQIGTTALDGSNDVLKICFPVQSRTSELIKVFSKYVDDHPERGHEKFTDVALAAFWDAYPCSQKPSSK
jgi:hypothetical protein